MHVNLQIRHKAEGTDMQGLVQDERKDPPNAGSGSSSGRPRENRFLIDSHASLRYMWLGLQMQVSQTRESSSD
jgi:hypothetical protein